MGERRLGNYVTCMSHHVYRLPRAVVLPDMLTLSFLVPQPQMRSRMSGQERVTDGAGGVPVSCLVSPSTSSHCGFEGVACCFPTEA